MPSFSIVVPTFNNEQTIGRALNSVISQKAPSDELIVVNDGSTDNTRSLLKQYAVPGLSVIDQENKGVSAARNTGIENAKHEHVCLLDADDEWCLSHLSDLRRIIDAFPGAAFFSTGFLFRDSDGSDAAPKMMSNKSFWGTIDDFPNSCSKYRGLVNSSSVCIRKSLFENGICFPEGESSGEDLYYWLRTSIEGSLAFSSRRSVIIHREKELGFSKSRASLGYHLKWYFDQSAYIKKLDNGKSFRRFIWRHSFRAVYAHAISGDKNRARTVIDFYMNQSDWIVVLFWPALFVPRWALKLLRYSALAARRSKV